MFVTQSTWNANDNVAVKVVGHLLALYTQERRLRHLHRVFAALSTLPKATKYIILSHCWGKGPPVCLINENLDEFQQSLPLSQLSPTFADALDLTRSLGFEYIWIGSDGPATASISRPWHFHVHARLLMVVIVSGCSTPSTLFLVSITCTLPR